jgi:hypothetical protein
VCQVFFGQYFHEPVLPVPVLPGQVVADAVRLNKHIQSADRHWKGFGLLRTTSMINEVGITGTTTASASPGRAF